MTDLKRRLEVGIAAATEAGRVTQRYFQTEIEVELKGDRSPVTIADREAESLLIDRLRAAFPDDSILGEEHGEQPGTSGYQWILDPIDGTKSFVQGVPLYGVMVGLLDPTREPVLGVVVLPGLDEVVAAARGHGCHWNGRGARVSEVDELDQACLVFTDLVGFDMTARREAFDRVRQRVRVVRGWGDCYGHILVATGRAEVMLDPILSVWDCAALPPILAEAGGHFTDWHGRTTVDGESGISTNAHLNAEVLKLVREPASDL